MKVFFLHIFSSDFLIQVLIVIYRGKLNASSNVSVYTNGRSRSRKRSRRSANDGLVKIKNWSRKKSHKSDGIGVGRIRTFPFSSDSAYEAIASVLPMI